MFGCCCGCAPLVADEWVNVTRVHDYSDPPNPDGISPYSRAWNVIGTDGSCTLAASTTPPTCGDPGQGVCYDKGFDGSAITPGDVPGVLSCPTGSTGTGPVSVVGQNCYQKTGQTVSIPRSGENCGLGWKGVQAYAAWPGRFGFIRSGGACCGGPTADEYTGLEDSKYLTIANFVRATYTRTEQVFYAGTWLTENCAHDWTQTASTDRYGNVTRAGTKSTDMRVDYSENYSGTHPQGYQRRHGCYDRPITSESNPTGATAQFPVAYQDLFNLLSNTAVSCGAVTTGWNSTWGDFGADTWQQFIANLQAAITNQSWTTTNDCDGVTYDQEVYSLTATVTSVNFSDSAWHFILEVRESLVQKACDAGVVVDNYYRDEKVFRIEVAAFLSVPLLFADVRQECIELLDTWPLNDDAVYPWRTDTSTWLMPWVDRDAYHSVPTIDWTVDENCAFTQSAPYSGQIRGAPLPAGWGRHFDFHHVNWDRGERDGICHACEESLGATSASPIPTTATQWTTYERGSMMFGPGAHTVQALDYEYSTGSVGLVPIDGIVMQKWAETVQAWPSYNRLRPCGSDRWKRDETEDACISSFDGTALVLDAYATTQFDVDDKIGLSFGGITGVYQVRAKSDAYTYTLGNATTDGVKLYTVPAAIDWEAGHAARMRWPDARPICGRLFLTSATQTAPGVVTVVTARDHWMREGDQVDFHAVPGLGTGVAVTVVSATSFTVAGTLGEYTTGGSVSSPGINSLTWQWDTTCSHGWWVANQAYSQRRVSAADPEEPDYRNIPEAIENVGPVPTTTAPMVIVCSPNEDDWPLGEYGDNYPFYHAIYSDMCLGMEWHCEFIQAIVDPLWQPPREPCGHSGPWGQAVQPCGAGVDAYEYPPLVEPFIVEPGVAPIPVPGSSLNIAYEGENRIGYYYDPLRIPEPVGVTFCVAIPNESSTLHSIRTAWLTCASYQASTKSETNANCPGETQITAADTTITAADTDVTAAG